MSTATQDQVSQTTALTHLAGKYLTFKLAAEEYGLEILKVREIIGLMEITCVPRTPGYIRGVINLRGKIIPVVNLRSKFDMASVDDTEQSCIIVVDIQWGDQPVQMGILVDTVQEVLDVDGNQIEPAPQFGGRVEAAFILGMAKCEGKVKILLNIDRVLADSELASLTDLAVAA